MTVGQKIKQSLGLGNYKYVYIRRLFGRSPNVYHIYVDTFLPDYRISPIEAKNYQTCQILGYSRKGLKKLKFTIPKLIDDFDEPVSSRDLFFVFDAAGEYRYGDRDYSVIADE